MMEFIGNTAYIGIPEGIDLAATFGCGQAFRWKPAGQDAWEGVAGGRYARIVRMQGGVAITPCDEAGFEGFWRHYLDLDSDYGALSRELKLDGALERAATECEGMRILNQPPWECLISFILSSNNNVKRISGIIERLCRDFGDYIEGRRAFPTAPQLVSAGEEGIRACGAGNRAAFVAGAARAVSEGFDLEALRHAGYETAKRELMRLDGVGEKVADCVLLFSLGYREAFPVDVWVRRSLPAYYPEAGKTPGELRRFAASRFGKLAGIAQQYIFHYERVIKPGYSTK